MDKEEIMELVEHIENVQRAAKKIANCLFDVDDCHLARKVLRSAYSHDNSKFDFMELGGLNVRDKRSKIFKDTLKKHYSNNPHHPEHPWWKGTINQMFDEEFIVMICNHYAKSCESGTDFKVWITEANDKYKMSPATYKSYKFYARKLLSQSN